MGKKRKAASTGSIPSKKQSKKNNNHSKVHISKRQASNKSEELPVYKEQTSNDRVTEEIDFVQVGRRTNWKDVLEQIKPALLSQRSATIIGTKAACANAVLVAEEIKRFWNAPGASAENYDMTETRNTEQSTCKTAAEGETETVSNVIADAGNGEAAANREPGQGGSAPESIAPSTLKGRLYSTTVVEAAEKTQKGTTEETRNRSNVSDNALAAKDDDVLLHALIEQNCKQRKPRYVLMPSSIINHRVYHYDCSKICSWIMPQYRSCYHCHGLFPVPLQG